MKRIPSLVARLALLTVMTMTPALASTTSSGEPFHLQRYTLPNGLRVWLQPRTDSQSVTALFVIGAGSRYETPANNGISHFVEHMLFAGSERWSEEEIKDMITRRGGKWNGWTGTEATTYYAEVAASDLDLALDWLAQVVFHPTFRPDKVENERRIIFQERWGRYGWLINTLDSLGFGYELDRDVRRALFPGSALGLRIVGEDASLDSLDRAALMSYYQSHYTPENAVLVMVGNVAPALALEQIEARLGVLERQGKPALPALPQAANNGPHHVVVRGPHLTDQQRLMVGAQTVGQRHPDRWALDVLAEVLGQDLMREIRYRQGLVYGVGAHNVTFDDVGYFAVSTTFGSGNRDKIMSAIEAHIESIRRGSVDAARVAEAKAALKGRWALAMEDSWARAGWLADWALVLRDDEPVPDYEAAIGAVTAGDLARVVNVYFIPAQSYVGEHQPTVTVARGTAIVGVTVGLGFAAWIGRKVWRRRTRRKPDGSVGA